MRLKLFVIFAYNNQLRIVNKMRIHHRYGILGGFFWQADFEVSLGQNILVFLLGVEDVPSDTALRSQNSDVAFSCQLL